MNWCCGSLEGCHSNVGCRGISVFVDDGDGLPAFVLQARALQVEDSDALPNMTIPLTVVSELTIVFCPWCGTKLDEHYESTWPELLRSDLRSQAY